MAYETGVASSAEDLVDKLFTFLTDGGIFTTPWVQDNLDLSGDKASIHLGNVYVHFKWNASPGTSINICQSLGFVAAGTNIDLHTNDSGNGSNTVGSERRAVFQVAGPWTKYHFFAYEGTEPTVYVVVEETPGVFRHAFGFGEAIKLNDWTGGEFAYGCYWDSNPSYADAPSSNRHSQLCDGVVAAFNQTLCATMHIEGMPNGPASHKWGVFATTGSPGNDGDGNGRVTLFGTSRGGPWMRALSWMRSSHLNSYKIFIPVTIFYRDTSDTPDEILVLGEMPNVAVVNMANFSPGDEVTVGSDTWMVFPWVRKQKQDAGTEESWNAGFAYKKVDNP
jgi:hypothetical protein